MSIPLLDKAGRLKLSKMLEQYKDEQSLNYSELAAMLDVTPQVMSTWVRASSSISYSSLEKLAQFWGRGTDDLLAELRGVEVDKPKIQPASAAQVIREHLPYVSEADRRDLVFELARLDPK